MAELILNNASLVHPGNIMAGSLVVRADIIGFARMGPMPVIRNVWRGGAKIA